MQCFCRLPQLILISVLYHAMLARHDSARDIAIETDAAGNLKPSKKKSTDRIDGIVAGVMALGRALVAGPEKRSGYETRGVIALEW